MKHPVLCSMACIDDLMTRRTAQYTSPFGESLINVKQCQKGQSVHTSTLEGQNLAVAVAS